MKDKESNPNSPLPDNGIINAAYVVADADVHLEGQRKPKGNKDGGDIPRIDIELEGNEPKAHDTKMSGNEEEEEEEGEKEVEETRTAPDGGYGWFIVLGCFLAHIILGSMQRCEGIYFLEFQKKFNKSAQLTAWPGGINAAIRCFLGPLAGALCSRYSVRSVCLVGSTFLFVGFLLNGFATDFFFLFFSHSLLLGIGNGFLYAPSINIVSRYFDKRRGLATGIGVSGTGVGTFALVPVAQLLFNTYHFQGTFMIIGAFCFNGAVCAMLYRPLSLHHKFQEGKENRKANGTEDNVAENVLENACRVQKEDETTEAKKEDEGLRTEIINKNASPVETGGKQKSKKSIFNLYLLKNPSFVMFCLSNLLFSMSIKSFFTFIPSLITSFGFSETEAAFALSIYGVADTIGRVFFGFLFDLRPFTPIRTILYTVLIYCMAVVSIFLPFFQNYAALCLIIAVYGILTGGYFSQKSITAVDILGVANIASSFGLLIFFQGIGVLLGPPLSGALKDITGSFIPLFYMGGGLMLCAGFLMVVSNIFLRRQRRREAEEAKTKTTTTTLAENGSITESEKSN